VKDAVTAAEFDLCRLPAGEAWSLPPMAYCSEDHARDEEQRVFRSSWLGVGRADMVAAPGDFITLEIAGHDLILLRDAEGVLRAFANTCRHRGARLVEEAGQCKGLRCPFHSWFYALDGRLVSAPKMDAAKGFEKAENGLIAYHAAERAGFAFVCLAPEAPDLDAWLGDFERIHADWPLAALRTLRRRELEVACNWKLFLEVFNEYYHLPFVHPDSIDSVYALPEPPDAVTGAMATQFGRTDGTGGLLEDQQNQALPDMPGLTGLAPVGARYTWLFPTMSFAANSDALWCYEAYPLGPDRCKVIQSSCFHPRSMELPDFAEKSAAYLQRMDAALDEDIPALVNQHRGMQNPAARQGRFQPELEPNVASFARWYAGYWV